MATATILALPDTSTLANFLAWAKGMADALKAMPGLVQSADTGQINWASVAAAPGSGAYTGYEIYRINDTLDATAPVYVKIEYGTGTANTPQLRVTVATATNGAGGLTGLVTTARAPSGVTQGAATQVPTYLCSGEGYLGIAFFSNAVASTVGGFFAIERSRNADGTVNNEAVQVFSCYETAAPQAQLQSSQVLSRLNNVVTTSLANWPGPPIDNYGAVGLAVGGVAPLVPAIIASPRLSATTGMVNVQTQDLPPRQSMPCTDAYGHARTYLNTGVLAIGNQTSSSALAMRFD